MVRKEEENNITTAPAAAPPPDLPPVPEMIMTAIETLNDKTGSEKSTIQKQIESTHSPLPESFSDSLSIHLDEMKKSGQLLLVNDKFKKPDADMAAPVRRGRGRPPKPKPALPSGYVVPPARPRGRPPKARDPLAPPPPPPLTSAAGGGSGRKRGRPPKADKPRGVSAPASGFSPNGEKRGRGRPPKVRAPVVVPVGS